MFFAAGPMRSLGAKLVFKFVDNLRSIGEEINTHKEGRQYQGPHARIVLPEPASSTRLQISLNAENET